MGMRKRVMCSAVLSVLALAAPALSAETGHQGMPGMKMEGHGTMMMQGQGMQGGHGMMRMGKRIFSGRIGPWRGEARIMDMKAQMEASGMKMQGAMANSHHIALSLTDPGTKKHVTEGKGKVTVIGPDKSMATTDFMAMQGHFGADVDLPKPGKYTFNVEIESGGKTGTATFHDTVK